MQAKLRLVPLKILLTLQTIPTSLPFHLKTASLTAVVKSGAVTRMVYKYWLISELEWTIRKNKVAPSSISPHQYNFEGSSIYLILNSPWIIVYEGMKALTIRLRENTTEILLNFSLVSSTYLDQFLFRNILIMKLPSH